MNTNRQTAIVVGVLFLLGYVGVFLGSAIYGPYVDAPDYLSVIYENKTPVIIGIFIELINDVAVIGIPVLLYPLLKKFDERIALGYLAIRVVEAVVLIVSKFNVLSLVQVSQEYLAAGAGDATYFQTVGASLLAQRYWASQIQVVFFCLGALVLYYVLYRTRLVPRFISLWGFFAVATLIAANVLPVPDLNEGFSPAQLLFLPIFLSEILLALWLIIKGFSPTAITAETADAQPTLKQKPA